MIEARDIVLRLGGRTLLSQVSLHARPGEVHVLRDPTRGGLGTSLCEIASTSGVGVEIEAGAVPVREPVRGACELLGIDPLFVANEGKLVAFVRPESANAVLVAMQATKKGRAGHTNWTIQSEQGLISDRNEYPNSYANWGHSASSSTPT